VRSLPFYTGLDGIVQNLTTADLQSYLAFRFVAQQAGLLSESFRNASFAMLHALTGVAALPTRGVQCVRSIDTTDLGFAVGHQFVSQYFDASVKVAAQNLVDGVEAAFGERLTHVDWLDNTTLAAAQHKLAQVKNKIGYPDVWQQFESVTFTKEFYDNYHTMNQYSRRRAASQVGQPTDEEVWGMYPQQINAYYDPEQNQMVFPAGILRGSFYNADAPGALNYGAIGGVIGHELSHGFDDQGRLYDGDGRLHPWWTNATSEKFDQRVGCVVQTYSNFTIQAGNETLHVNGNLTLGENLADMGGIANSYRAYQAKLKSDAQFAAQEAMINQAFNGLTGDQLYFVAWAQNWCALRTDASASQQIKTDPHSPSEIRVLGPVSQTPMFADAFGCKATTKYNPATRCSVW